MAAKARERKRTNVLSPQLEINGRDDNKNNYMKTQIREIKNF